METLAPCAVIAQIAGVKVGFWDGSLINQSLLCLFLCSCRYWFCSFEVSALCHWANPAQVIEDIRILSLPKSEVWHILCYLELEAQGWGLAILFKSSRRFWCTFKFGNGWHGTKVQKCQWLTLSLVLYTRNFDSQSAVIFHHS